MASGVKVRKNQASSLESILQEYPLEEFPNWNITNGEKYYVHAPVDRWFGDWSFHIRSHITALILAGNPAISFLQRFRSERMTKIAFFFSFLGLEEFLIGLIVTNMWLFDARLGRLLAFLLSLGFFLSGSLKVAFSLPRPPTPPAIALSEESQDWAWPSNHALLGTAFPWFIWIYTSSHYDLSIGWSLVLLSAIITWNLGVSFSRVYLSVHSPCDVLGGWTIGVLLLFIFEGFSDKLHTEYIASSADSGSFYLYVYAFLMLLIYVHPRSWPETQSFGEVVSVISGAAAIWAGRYLALGGPTPPVSLYEENSDADVYQYFARMILGILLVVLVRQVTKPLAKMVVTTCYELASLRYYSYSTYMKALGKQNHPTKRYNSRMRFRKIVGEKLINMEEVPYDVDLPVKFVVYTLIGYSIAEVSPFLFSVLGI